MTEVDFDLLTTHQRYKLMASLIVPRPIALMTTLSARGIANAAPFSMFNMIGEDPPILIGELKTFKDIRRSKAAPAWHGRMQPRSPARQ